MGFASGRVLRGVLCVALGGICWGFWERAPSC